MMVRMDISPGKPSRDQMRRWLDKAKERVIVPASPELARRTGPRDRHRSAKGVGDKYPPGHQNPATGELGWWLRITEWQGRSTTP